MAIEGNRIKVYRNLRMLGKTGKESFSVNCHPDYKGQPEELEQKIIQAFFYFFGQYMGQEDGSELDQMLRQGSSVYGIIGDSIADDDMSETSSTTS